MSATTTASALRAQGLAVRHRDRALVGPLDLALAPGRTLGLRGPSGAGKSTVLRALVGLLPEGLALDGTIEVLGVDVRARRADLPALRTRAVLVGQTPTLFGGSVLDNALFGLRHAVRAPRPRLVARAEAALAEAGLWDEVRDRLDAPADQLSVGQRQRLCLARALALDPELLLLDEPTSALDARAAATVEDALAGLTERRTVLLVSHDRPQLERLCHDVVVVGDEEAC